MIRNTVIRVEENVTVNEEKPKINVLKAFGNFIKEIGCVQRLSKTVENEMMNIVSMHICLFLSLNLEC